MNVRGTAGRLVAALAVVILLGGCAAGASPTPGASTQAPATIQAGAIPTATPTSRPSAAPSLSAARDPSATPISYGPVTVVTGTDSCPSLDPIWTKDPDGTAHVRDLAVECVDTTDDVRVNGTATGTWNMDVWGEPDRGIGAGVQWGTMRLVNDGGAWDGKLSGVAALPQPGDTIVIWYTGSGGYAGLTYFQLITGHAPTWKVQGQIYPGDLPTR